jgi:serine protease Do
LKRFLYILLVALLGALIGVFVFTRFLSPHQQVVQVYQKPVDLVKLPIESQGNIVNFVDAAAMTVHAVVHVKTESVKETYYRNPIYEFFYGERYKESQPVIGFGSGVIVSGKGHIVTNNHVITNSEKVFVTLNDKREFEAKVLGTDPTTDLAVIKIDLENTPFIPYGSSDDLKVGEWVLAVGNPFNLTSTVTAGIVSAKGRSLGIIAEDYRLESFIQTDAAVNRGNSGGALVNIKGELIGINTAIISPSGGSVGNSFAVPVSIVEKVVADIIEFGTVQRALLGVTIDDVTPALAEKSGLKIIKGVYIRSLSENSAAKDAGIKEGDIIISVNEVEVNSTSELQEQIGRYRPGQKIDVLVWRDNKRKLFKVTLRNMQGKAQLIEPYNHNWIYGAVFKPISVEERQELNIESGLKIVEIKSGKLMQEGVREGFILMQVNQKTVYSVEELSKALTQSSDGVYIKGVYPDGAIAYYAFEK